MTTMRHIWTVLAGVALSLAAVSAGQAQTRRALVIGVNDYVNVPKLQKAVGDAQALKTTLEKLGFAVDILVNPDRRAFNVGISSFAGKLQPGDSAVVHFSGHGVALDGENYLLPVDVPQPGAGDKELLKSESIALSTVIDRIRSTGARTQVFIIDACRDNPYAGTGSRSVGTRGGLANVPPPSGPGGIFIMYSAGFGQTAADRLADNDPEPTSLYTRTLLRKMTVEGKPITDLAREVREDVEALASGVGHEQRPAYYDELSGPPFFFAAPRGDKLAAARSGDVELAFWSSIKDTRNAALFRDYLDKFGERGMFAAIANARLKELDAQQAARAPAAPPQASAPVAAPSGPAATTFQPSFDCGPVRGGIEQVICANAALASRDRIMSQLYYQLADALPADGRAALRGEQRDWLTRRRACERVPPEQMAGCLAQVYDARIAELQGRGATSTGTLQNSAQNPIVAVTPRSTYVPPSFDCSADVGALEKAICADQNLAGKDRMMASLYGQLVQGLGGPERQNLIDAQRAWLRTRNQCREPGLATCLAGAYDRRISELQAAGRR